MNWREAIDQLRRDNRSGAEEITMRAVEILIEAIGDSVPGSLTSYRQWLVRLGRQVIGTHPSMASLFQLVNAMLWHCHEAISSEDARRQVLEYLQAYRASADIALQTLAERAFDLLSRYETIMTYSRSSTVVRALRELAERHVNVHILCSESRPMLEGQTLASELSWAGLQVTVGIDMALFDWLPSASAIVIGADSLSTWGLVNKLGTRSILEAAAEQEIPRIVLCTSRKLLPSDYVIDVARFEGPPEEIMPVTHENLVVRNRYFDLSPLDLISLVITENGPLSGDDLELALQRLKTYPGLRGGR